MKTCRECEARAHALTEDGLCGPCYINWLAKVEEGRVGSPDRRRAIKKSK